MTWCCCTVSASRFSILILSSFLSNHFAPHQFPCSTKPLFSWSTIVALSLSLSCSLSLYATCVYFLFPTNTHTYTLLIHKRGRCSLYYFLWKLILNPVLIATTTPCSYSKLIYATFSGVLIVQAEGSSRRVIRSDSKQCKTSIGCHE